MTSPKFISSPFVKWQLLFLLTATLIGILWAYSSQKAWIEITFHQSCLMELAVRDSEGSLLIRKEFQHPARHYGFSLRIRQQQLPVLYLTTQSADSWMSRLLLGNHGNEQQIRWAAGSHAGKNIYWNLHNNEITPVQTSNTNLADNIVRIEFSELPSSLQSQPSIDFLHASTTALVAQQLLLAIAFWLKKRFSRIIWH